ncbi:sulfatase [Rhodobacteraceae bacterium WD3A24]|nr:sulfatase [Rhodobacteraceae bacterium WD3A24]
MRQGAGLVAATLALHLVLIQPNHPAAMTPGALLVFPLELPAIVLLLVALPPAGRSTAAVRAGLVAAIMVIAVAKLADYASFVAFDRGFNAVVDGHLIHAGWTLARATFGLPLAALGAALGIAAIALAGWVLWWATGRWARLAPPRALGRGAMAAVLPAAALAGLEVGAAMNRWQVPAPIPGAAFTARVGVERAVQWSDTLADLAAFRRAARQDSLGQADDLLDRIGATDILVTFVESYGRSSIDNPIYARTHVPTLERIGARLGARGLAVRSGWMRAPTTGGQSWLSHATLASGLWIDNQGRYQAMLSSPRRTLYHIAGGAGFRTAAVMPAITMAWPEGRLYGFEAIHAADDLGYAGPAFNWVTMPDQYTLSALDRLERRGAPGRDRRPLFAQIALVSSHAPWVPVIDLVAWGAVDDGTVFRRWEGAGEAPEVVWRDRDRVRDQFRRAIDYSLRVVGSYAARHADAPPLLIVTGDHEPARFVSGMEESVVPVHVIGPRRLVDRFADWGWTRGMVPGDDAAVVPMDGFRDRFLRSFSSAVAP